LSGRRTGAAVLALLILTGGVAFAAPPTDRVLPAGQHTTEKARTLATTYVRALQELNAGIYHCWPWVETQKASIGFYRPKNVTPRTEDDRYLSIRIYVEQDPSPAFGKLTFEERSTAMFSRYAGPLLRRMTRDAALAADPTLDGFTAILEWMKQAPPVNGRPVHETIAIFMDRESALEYVSGRTDNRTLSARARVLGFDGETPLGAIKIAPTWDDSFVTTYKVQNYQLEPGVTC
jgi:hypothetical protein